MPEAGSVDPRDPGVDSAAQGGCAPAAGNVRALALVLNLLGKSADPERMAHDAAGAGDILTLVRLARSQGLKARLVSPKFRELPDMPVPALAEIADGRVLVLAKAGAEDGLTFFGFPACKRETNTMPEYKYKA
jgi:ABC-type bacteriocin/lantibiotic exporter with double-glycine peptidase domain